MMKNFIHIVQFIFYFTCTNALYCNAQAISDSYSFINAWGKSSNVAMDSLVNVSKDSILLVNYKSSKESFQNSRNIRVMGINNLLEKMPKALCDINSNTVYLIELESSGYCSYYGLYILKKEGESYFFEAECASRTVYQSKKIKYSFEELNRLIKEFTPHGNNFYDTTCMITIITDGNFKSFPLLYFDSNDIKNLKNKIKIKWHKVK